MKGDFEDLTQPNPEDQDFDQAFEDEEDSEPLPYGLPTPRNPNTPPPWEDLTGPNNTPSPTPLPPAHPSPIPQSPAPRFDDLTKPLAEDLEPEDDGAEIEVDVKGSPAPLSSMMLKGRIEAMLFLTGKPLTLEELVIQLKADIDEIEMAMMELIQDYAFRDESALEIDDSDGYILQVKESYQSVVEEMLPVDITSGALRTLSAIALKAPILQSDLVELRGSNAYDHIHELLARKLIAKKRKGRSYMLSLTQNFHQYFKLTGDRKELEVLVQENWAQ